MANYCYNEITITGPTAVVRGLHTEMLNVEQLTDAEIAEGLADRWAEALLQTMEYEHDADCEEDEEGHHYVENTDGLFPFNSLISVSDDVGTSTLTITCHTKWVPFLYLFSNLAYFYPDLTIEVWGEEFGAAGAWRSRWVKGDNTVCETATLLSAEPAPDASLGYVLMLLWADRGELEVRVIEEPKSEVLRVWLLGVPNGEMDPEGTVLFNIAEED